METTLTHHVRRVLEVLLAPFPGVRRVPKELGGGAIWFTAGAAGLKYWFRRWKNLDPDLVSAAARLVAAGDVVWDVGANVGLFTVTAAGLSGSSGHVLAIEPDPSVARWLERSARDRRNAGLATITPIRAAVAGEPAVSRLEVARRSRASNALERFGATQMGGVRARRLTPVLSLDVILETAPTPQVVKIDVEGAEVEVLRGSETLLRSVRPALLMEVSKANASGVTELLRTAGYDLFEGAVAHSGDPVVAVEEAGWSTVALHPDSAAHARWVSPGAEARIL